MWGNGNPNSFASDFERVDKNIVWQGFKWIPSPTPRDLGEGSFCQCCKDGNGKQIKLLGQELLDHFDKEVKITLELVKEKFGKVKVIQAGGKWDHHNKDGIILKPRGKWTVFMIERVTAKLPNEDKRNIEIDWKMDSNGWRQFNDEQKVLFGHRSTGNWNRMVHKLIMESKQENDFWDNI